MTVLELVLALTWYPLGLLGSYIGVAGIWKRNGVGPKATDIFPWFMALGGPCNFLAAIIAECTQRIWSRP